MKCPRCGSNNPPIARFCHHCGATLSPRRRIPWALIAAIGTIGLLGTILVFTFSDGSAPDSGSSTPTSIAFASLTPVPTPILPTATPIPPPDTPIPLSPTSIPPTAALPAKIQAGVYAKVAGTGASGARFRSGPGEDFVTWRILPDGEVLRITGGPEVADGVVWWRSVDKSGLVGWAPERYLVPISPPAWTPEPERTPDLGS